MSDTTTERVYWQSRNGQMLTAEVPQGVPMIGVGAKPDGQGIIRWVDWKAGTYGVSDDPGASIQIPARHTRYVNGGAAIAVIEGGERTTVIEGTPHTP